MIFPNAKLIKNDEKLLILYMVRKRKQGHYCRICGEYKAYEKCRGKGHAHNICKSCMSNKKIDTAITTFEQEILCDDDDEQTDTILVEELFGSGHDPFNPEIDNLPPTYAEQKKYKKLNKEEKTALKELWIELVLQYWTDNHQIPFGESFSLLKRLLFEIFKEQGQIELKDDNDLKIVLHDSMIVAINKKLLNK